MICSSMSIRAASAVAIFEFEDCCHGRACPGHPRLAFTRWKEDVDARLRAGMTNRVTGGLMLASPRIRTILTLAIALLGLSAAHAQEKVWKHGILEAKSDAGFIAMVDKGGFAAKRGLKVELLQIKAGATLMK